VGVGELDAYTCEPFTADGKTRDVYRTGEGPAVVVVHEVPGITPNVADFGRRVAAIGCTAVLPSLFGTPGKPIGLQYGLTSMVKCCISSEFTTFALKKTSPITVYLRALAKHEHERCGGPGVGVVGMCMTGNFALAMMVDDTVLAPVLAQPSLPFSMGAARKADLNLSNDDLARVKERAAAGVCVLGLRFTGDKLVPAERFQTLRRELGDAFVAVEIDSSKGNAKGHPSNAHSVLTEHLDEDALDQVLDLFRTRLLV
jgi:dienelactone hydrolase